MVLLIYVIYDKILFKDMCLLIIELVLDKPNMSVVTAVASLSTGSTRAVSELVITRILRAAL